MCLADYVVDVIMSGIFTVLSVKLYYNGIYP